MSSKPTSSASSRLETELEHSAPQIEWPQLKYVAQLPEPDWIEATRREVAINISEDKNGIFKYAPIAPNQIRLLCLSPAASYEAPLEGSMLVCNFPRNALRGWHALSYTWGNADELPGLILIDYRKKKITQNLDLALRHLRDHQHSIAFWIDALCINQEDLVEKGYQIQHMRFIHERANSVKVWLGRGGQLTKKGMDFLSLCMLSPDDILVDMLSQGNWSNDVVAGLTAILSKPYWERMWIIQGLVCGTNVQLHCGNKQVSFDVLPRVRKLLAEVRQNLGVPQSSVPDLKALLHAGLPLDIVEISRNHRMQVGQARTALKTSTPASGLLGLLVNGREHQAKDPLDKVYALLGIVEDLHWCSQVFPVDYNITAEQLYIDIAKWMIVHDERLTVFCYPIKSSLRNLPSWCPDWTIKQTTNDILRTSEAKLIIPPELWRTTEICFPDNRTLTATGVLIDGIFCTTGAFDWTLLHYYQLVALTQPAGRIALRGTYTALQTRALQNWLRQSATVFRNKTQVPETVRRQRAVLWELHELIPHLYEDSGIKVPFESLLNDSRMRLQGTKRSSDRWLSLYNVLVARMA